jgi:HEAT repeat protein
MRNWTRIAAAALLSITAISQPAQGLQYVWDRQTIEDLVDEFERTVLWRQLELAKKIVSLQDRQLLARLEPRLKDADRHDRANIAFVFAGLGDERGFQVLANILNDRSDRPEGQGIPGGRWSLARQIAADRYYAVHVLGHLQDRRAVDLLLPLLKDPDVNYKAAWALGEVGDAGAIGPLIDALRHHDALVRISAIHALVKLRANEALPHLRAMLNDHALPRAGDQISVADTAKAAIVAIDGSQARKVAR